MSNEQKTRKIDQAFSENRSWLSKQVIIVKKSKIINLRNFIIVAFLAGAIFATIWLVDTNRQTQSHAAISPGTTQQAQSSSSSPSGAGMNKYPNGSACLYDYNCVSGRCGCFYLFCKKKCY